MRAKMILIAILLSTVLLSGCGLIGGGQPTAQQPATPEQLSKELVNQLNTYLMAMDPIGYVIDAKFQALDARPRLGNEEKLVEWEILVDCQSQTAASCSKERTAAVFFQALRARYGVLGSAFPETVKDLTLYTFDHMRHNGTIRVKWKEVNDYLRDVIGGAQLATRLEISNP